VQKVSFVRAARDTRRLKRVGAMRPNASETSVQRGRFKRGVLRRASQT